MTRLLALVCPDVGVVAAVPALVALGGVGAGVIDRRTSLLQGDGGVVPPFMPSGPSFGFARNRLGGPCIPVHCAAVDRRLCPAEVMGFSAGAEQSRNPYPPPAFSDRFRAMIEFRTTRRPVPVLKLMPARAVASSPGKARRPIPHDRHVPEGSALFRVEKDRRARARVVADRAVRGLQLPLRDRLIAPPFWAKVDPLTVALAPSPWITSPVLLLVKRLRVTVAVPWSYVKIPQKVSPVIFSRSNDAFVGLPSEETPKAASLILCPLTVASSCRSIGP